MPMFSKDGTYVYSFMSNGTTKGRTCGFGGGGSKLRC